MSLRRKNGTGRQLCVVRDVRLVVWPVGSLQIMSTLPFGVSHPFPVDRAYNGGGMVITREVFVEMNGFSNSFWAWGSEDDEFATRLLRAGSGSGIALFVVRVAIWF